jgi:hypothetical protein
MLDKQGHEKEEGDGYMGIWNDVQNILLGVSVLFISVI